MELFLIRHGQSLNNALPEVDRVEDPGLTDVGHQQCGQLAEWLSSLELTRIVTSPFLRALQTANYVGRSTKLRPEVRIDLHETGGCVSGSNRDVFVGRPGMTRAQIRAQFPDFNIATNIDSKGWWGSKPFETDAVARKRAERLLAQTAEEFKGTEERVAFVMHGDFKRLILAELHTRPLQIPFNTAITKIVIRSNRCHLDDYNRVDHLPAELVTF